MDAWLAVAGGLCLLGFIIGFVIFIVNVTIFENKVSDSLAFGAIFAGICIVVVLVSMGIGTAMAMILTGMADLYRY